MMPDGAPSAPPSEDHHHVAPGKAWRGLRGGLMPLAVVVVCVAATVGPTVEPPACVCAQRCSSRDLAPHPARARCPARVVAMHTDLTVRTTEVWGTTIEFRARMIYLVRKGLRRLQEA